MPFDQSLADRVRPLLVRRRGFSEKKMFGGLGFLLHGNMCVGVWKEFLIVRVGPDSYEDALAEPSAREFDITGRAMTGWVMVESDGLENDGQLSKWVQQAMDFCESLPKK
jgi:TfoX/Sxy family transcriptional regulator of competence genes